MKLKLIQLLSIKINAVNKFKFNKKKNFRYYDPLQKMESFKQICSNESDLTKDAESIAIYIINQNEYLK